MNMSSEFNENKIPNHLGLIPDGNRRWAKKNNKSSLEGHKEGYRNFKKFCRWCRNRGVKILTAYAFSTENWNRPQKEIDYLMNLFVNAFEDTPDEDTLKEKTRIKVVGKRKNLPDSLIKAIEEVEQETKDNKELELNLALGYGGRWDIIQAIKKIVKEKESVEEKIGEEEFKKHLSVKSYPDLVIRTGKEKRLSNFFIWQVAYSELYFSDKLWPEFTEKDLDKAFKDYAERERRHGH